jgi:hypothetical protein
VSHIHTRQPPLKPEVAHLVGHITLNNIPYNQKWLIWYATSSLKSILTYKSGSSNEPFPDQETSFAAEVAHLVCHFLIQEHPHLQKWFIQ